MGYWKRMGRRFNERIEKMTDAVSDTIEDASDLAESINNIKKTGRRVLSCAKETHELCETTQAKGDQMVEFSRGIQETLNSFDKNNMTASAIETIKDLTDGDKLREAMDIAKGMDEIAIGCAEKSVEMIDVLDEAVAALPDRFEAYVGRQARRRFEEDDDDEKEALEALDRDILEVEDTVASVHGLHIGSAFEIGVRAFKNLTEKADVAKDMFTNIQDFSVLVMDISNEMREFDVINLIKKVKDLLRIIFLTDVMKKFAEGAKRIMEVIINLFRATADKISSLWSALARAKDCMAECIRYILEALGLCNSAKEKGLAMIDKTTVVIRGIEDVGDVDFKGGAINALKEMLDGEEIRDAIDEARGMDDIILEAVGKVSDMIDRVADGFGNMPEILTDGIIDKDGDGIPDDEQEGTASRAIEARSVKMEKAGKKDDDPDPVDVEDDKAELDQNKELVRTADVFSAKSRSLDGFRTVVSKASRCDELMADVTVFVKKSEDTVNDFLGVWDMESALEKMWEMCRLVRLGEMIRQFANQVKRLVQAIIDFLKSVIEKFKEFGDFIENAVDDVKDKIFGFFGCCLDNK